jgi:hypothetical protein
VENCEFERTEAARTGSVGVKQAAMTKDVGQPVWKMRCIIRAQINQLDAITGPRRIRRDG